jgi:hypothetical protein
MGFPFPAASGCVLRPPPRNKYICRRTACRACGLLPGLRPASVRGRAAASAGFRPACGGTPIIPYSAAVCTRAAGRSVFLGGLHILSTHSLQTVQASIKLYSHSSCNIIIATRAHHTGKRKAQAPLAKRHVHLFCARRAELRCQMRDGAYPKNRVRAEARCTREQNKPGRLLCCFAWGRPAATGNLSAQSKVST